MELAPTLGGYITRARERLDWSMADLGREAHVSQATISRFEADLVADPSPRKLRRIADALGVPPADLMRLADYLPTEDAAPDAEGPATQHALAGLRALFSRGPWSPNLTAPLYALLVETADDRREHWRERYEAITAQVADSDLLAILRQPITEQAKLEALTAAIGHLVFSQPPSLPSLHPD